MFEQVKNCGAGKFISNHNWIHPDRVIDSYELLFVTKGCVYLHQGDIDHELKANDILILEPDIRHFGYKPSTDTEFFWLHWASSDKLLPKSLYTAPENPYRISLYFRQLIEARVTNMPDETMDYLTRLILLELFVNANQSGTNAMAEKIRAWIKANSHAPITVSQIADRFGYNVDYLNRLYKISFQKNIKAAINEERIRYLKMLMLYDNIPLKEVAIKAGFSDYKYFLQFFKYHEGITPTQFYKQFSKIYINSR